MTARRIGHGGQPAGHSVRCRFARGCACYHRRLSYWQGRPTINSRLVGDITVFLIRGTLTAASGEAGLRQAIRLAVDQGSRAVVINLQDAAAIDSSGVSDLASSHMVLAAAGGVLKICCLSQKLKDIFVVTRLNTVFDIHETEAQAIASAQSS